MIDLQEPGRASYSAQEQALLKHQFILLVHTLLLAYLALHNLIIPMVANILRGHNLLIDVHFWFLFQLPLQWYLRQMKPLPMAYVQFLILGTLARLLFEFNFATQLKTWQIFSVLISEFSATIFFFLVFPALAPKKLFLSAFLGLLVAPMLGLYEVRSESNKMLISTPFLKQSQDHLLGCRGAEVTLQFPLPNDSAVQSSAIIRDCGFDQNLVRTGKSFHVLNQGQQQLNLRLYRLYVLHGKVRWKFLRLIQVAPGETWEVGELLKDDVAYLIKSPERRKLGNLVIVPAQTGHFPLGPGSLKLNYDSLEWRADER
jgi:hypothetical protein